jgi:hypothetical protein
MFIRLSNNRMDKGSMPYIDGGDDVMRLESSDFFDSSQDIRFDSQDLDNQDHEQSNEGINLDYFEDQPFVVAPGDNLATLLDPLGILTEIPRSIPIPTQRYGTRVPGENETTPGYAAMNDETINSPSELKYQSSIHSSSMSMDNASIIDSSLSDSNPFKRSSIANRSSVASPFQMYPTSPLRASMTLPSGITSPNTNIVIDPFAMYSAGNSGELEKSIAEVSISPSSHVSASPVSSSASISMGLVLASVDGNGLELKAGCMYCFNCLVSRRFGQISLHLTMTNKGVSPLANFKMIFNKNSYSLRIDRDALGGIEVLEAGRLLETCIGISCDGVFSQMVPVNSMAIGD